MEFLTCNETLIFQLPEEHSDFVQIQQGCLGVFQHGPLLFLPEERKKAQRSQQEEGFDRCRTAGWLDSHNDPEYNTEVDTTMSQSGPALENPPICPPCQMKTENLSSPGEVLAWTGSAAAHQ